MAASVRGIQPTVQNVLRSTRCGMEGVTAVSAKLVLLTGATGYVGGRLLRELESRDVRVRCLARHPEWLRGRVGLQTEVVAGDVLDPGSLLRALDSVHTAYYLVHSMGAGKEFESRDRQAASNFAAGARQAGVRRIIYLGGLGRGDALSPHLRSRQEVGRLLGGTAVPVIEFRAGVVIGSGSLSFEMIRALVERLPVMVTPRWVGTPTQPIAIEDLLAYLVAALELPEGRGAVYEIGAAAPCTYGELMREYARQRGLRRAMIPVPVITPRLSSLWLALVTPLYASIGRKLADGLRNPTVVHDTTALRDFGVRPRGVRAAVERALHCENRELALTRWSDALAAAGEPRSWGGVRFGSRIVDSRTASSRLPPAAAFAPIRRIGGERGWYAANVLWRLRGGLDLLVGGVGVRRGRRDPERLEVGDPLDFWRVEAFEPDRLLRLAAEMKLPGRAWLEFEVMPQGAGSIVRQTALFDPVGLFGQIYWYGLYPVHRFVFSRMLRGIVAAGQPEPQRS